MNIFQAICGRLTGHRFLRVTAHLPWIVALKWGSIHPGAGCRGTCRLCGAKWDDTNGSCIALVEGDGRPKVFWF